MQFVDQGKTEKTVINGHVIIGTAAVIVSLLKDKLERRGMEFQSVALMVPALREIIVTIMKKKHFSKKSHDYF